MSHFQRVFMSTAVATLLLTALTAGLAAADYGNRTDCKKPNATHATGTLRLRPFAGHDLVVNYDLCWIHHPSGFIGPVAGEGEIVFAAEPNIRTPDKFPGAGIGETVEVKQGKWLGGPLSITYPFEVKHRVIKVFGEQSFDMELKVSQVAASKKVQLCFGKTCTSRKW